jgi:hypothetical protein
MTPAAPTATWRRVCQEYFSRLIEDLEQGVESEVESRVTAAMEAAIRGAVADAIGESRRALAEDLNQAVRRLRQATDVDDLNSIVLDVTAPFCEQAVVFCIHENSARAERMRRPAQNNAGEGGAAASLPPLVFTISKAAAFATVIDTRDPVVAMSTPAEVSPQLVALFGHKSDERVYLFPLAAGGRVAGIFYAGLRVQAPPLEMLCEVAGLRLHTLTQVPAVAAAVANAPVPVPAPTLPQLPDHLVGISGYLSPQPAAAVARAPENNTARQHKEWWDLSRQEQQLHLAAQRFARVQVAEMRLATSEAFRAGRSTRDIYGTLKQPIEEARQQFREKHMTVSLTMVDYLHLEMVRSLADDDANMLGPNYPGPLV